MKLSEILKSEMSSSAVISPNPPPKQPPPAVPSSLPPSPVPAPKAPIFTSQDVAAAIERAVTEARLKFEEDFKKEIQKIQVEAQQVREEQLREEEKKSFVRTETMKKEKQQLAAQFEALQRENESLKTVGHVLENAKKEISEMRSKMAEEFQKKIAAMELDHQRKEDVLPAPMATPAVPVEPTVSIPKPIIPPPISVISETEEAPVIFNPARAEKARDLYQTLLASTQNFFEKARQNEINTQSLTPVIARFIEQIDLHDDLISVVAEPYTLQQVFSYHAVNSCILAIVLGTDLKLGPEEMRDLGIAALLYDMGLLKNHENLDCPRNLPGQVQSDVSKHPEESAALLRGHISEAALTAIEQHHELMNGKGYPKGIPGEDILFLARIISIVDSFEAMIHERPYRQKPLEINQAVKEMIETERGLYDRDVMKALLARVGLYPIRSLVELSNKQVARVLRQNRLFPLSPVVQIEFDESGLRLARPIFLDLSKNQLIHIIGPVKSTPSYAREQVQKRVVKQKPVNAFQEALPLLIMAAVLVLLVYLIVKI